MALALGWAALFFAVNDDPARYFSSEWAMWRFQRDATTASADVQVLILGDSRTMGGIDPILLRGFESRSLALGGTTAIEAYYQLVDYLDHHEPPAALVVGFAPYHMVLHDAFWDRTVKFGFLSRERYVRLLEDAERLDDASLGDPEPLATERRTLESYGRYAASPRNPIDFSAEILSSFFLRRSENEAAARALEAHRGFFLFGHREESNGLSEEAGFASFEPSALLDSYLEALIDYAEAHGIEVYWYTMPINATSMRALSPIYRRGFSDYLRDLEIRERGLLAASDLSSLPDDHFGDRSHLNARGVARVSAALERFLFDASPHLRRPSSPDANEVRRAGFPEAMRAGEREATSP
jgi:hypothetical protein